MRGKINSILESLEIQRVEEKTKVNSDEVAEVKALIKQGDRLLQMVFKDLKKRNPKMTDDEVLQVVYNGYVLDEGVNPEKAAKKLISDVRSKIKSSEHKTVKLKGVGNLSRSDLETLELYADTFLNSGDFSGLMSPRGSIETVLKKYGVLESKEDVITDDEYV